MAWLAKTVCISARSASISWVRRTRCSWVSSQNGSKRSVRASTESSKSGVGLEGAASEGCCGGGVREGVEGQNNGLRLVWEWTPARFGAGARHRGTRVQARRIKGRSKNGECLSLNKVNVATFGCNVATFQRGKHPTSRRRDPTSRRRDPTSRRRDPTSRRRDPTSQRRVPTSRRRDPTSRRCREW